MAAKSKIYGLSSEDPNKPTLRKETSPLEQYDRIVTETTENLDILVT
jgi:hypothetical protein